MSANDGDLLRVGIVGAGTLGRHLGDQVYGTTTARVAAIADPDDGNRTAAGETFDVPVEHQYESHESMLDDAALDAVIVASPHVFHDEQVTAALDHGLDVLCEKPLVLDTHRAVELRDRAANQDATLMVGYQRHFEGAYVRARKRYLSSRDIAYVNAELTQDWIEPFRDAWRTNRELSGGGFLVDTGRHVVDAILWITGLDPVAVRADMAEAEPGVDYRTSLSIDFANGATANVMLYGDSPCVRESLSFCDEDGAAEIRGRGWNPRELVVTEADGTETSPHFDRNESTSKVEVFVEAVRNGTEPPATARDAIRASAVVEAAYESAATGERVEIDTELWA